MKMKKKNLVLLGSTFLVGAIASTTALTIISQNKVAISSKSRKATFKQVKATTANTLENTTFVEGQVVKVLIDGVERDVYTTKPSDFAATDSLNALKNGADLSTNTLFNVKVPATTKNVYFDNNRASGATKSFYEKIVRVDFTGSTANKIKMIRMLPELREIVFTSNINDILNDSIKNNPKLEKLTNLQDLNVTGLFNGVFYGSNIPTLTNLPNNLTIIGDWTFGDSKSLRTVDLSNTKVTTIGTGAFQNTEIKHFYAPETLTTVGKEMFIKSTAAGSKGVTKHNVNLPASLNNVTEFIKMGIVKADGTTYSSTESLPQESISLEFNQAKINSFLAANPSATDLAATFNALPFSEKASFVKTNLATNASVTSIDTVRKIEAVKGTDGITTITVTLNSLYSAGTTALSITLEKRIPTIEVQDGQTPTFVKGSLTKIHKGSNIYKVYTPLDDEYTINGNLSGLKSIVGLTNDIYFNVEVPEKVGAIYFDNNTTANQNRQPEFYNKIVRVDFTNSNCGWITMLRELPELKEIVFSAKNSKIDMDSIKGNPKLEKLTNLDKVNVTEFYNGTFDGSNISILNNLPSKLTTLGNWAFGDSKNLTTVDLSNTSITSIGEGAFQRSNIKHFYAPESLTTMGNDVFLKGTNPVTKYNVNLPDQFNKADEFIRLGILKPDGTAYATGDTITTEDVSITFNEAKINEILNIKPNAKNSDLATTFNNLPFTEKVKLVDIKLNSQTGMSTIDFARTITATADSTNKSLTIEVKLNSLYTSTNTNKITIDTSSVTPTPPGPDNNNGGETTPPTPNPDQPSGESVQHKSNAGAIAGSIVAVILAIIIISGLVYFFKKRKAEQEA